MVVRPPHSVDYPHTVDQLRSVADEMLVARAADGDPRAFEMLVARHGPLMRAYTARILGSLTEADDVVQEAFTIAWRQLPTLRDPTAVKAWLMRIASRAAFSHARKRATEQPLPLPLLERAMPLVTQPENVAVHNAQLEALSAALDKLPEEQRRCWLLREIAELSYDDIAAETGLPAATVRGRLARARSSIYAQMEGWR